MLLGGFAPAVLAVWLGASPPLIGYLVGVLRVFLLVVWFSSCGWGLSISTPSQLDLLLGRRGLFFERGGTGVVPSPGPLVSDDWSTPWLLGLLGVRSALRARIIRVCR